MVGRRYTACHKHCVDKAAGTNTANLCKDDCKGARGGILGGEPGIIVRHVQTYDGNGDQIEQNHTPEDITDHTGKSFGWVLGLPGCDCDGFSATTTKVSWMLLLGFFE